MENLGWYLDICYRPHCCIFPGITRILLFWFLILWISRCSCLVYRFSNFISEIAILFFLQIRYILMFHILFFFQGSSLVRFFSKFTKDIFAALISLLFIFEAFNKLVKVIFIGKVSSYYLSCLSPSRQAFPKLQVSGLSWQPPPPLKLYSFPF